MSLRRKRKDDGRPHFEFMRVTPSMARRWLEGANTHNRPEKSTFAAGLARDILHGDYIPVPSQGIAFDPHGTLLDGQNRLKAIVLADKAVHLYVWFNVPTKCQQVMDRGKPRTLLDVTRLTGVCGHLTNNRVATMRGMYTGNGPAKRTDAEETALLIRHADAISFADHYCRSNVRGVTISAVRGVVARAYYSADHERLGHFCNVLSTGIGRNGDGTVVSLWKALVQQEFGGGRKARERAFHVTERALSAYLKGERLSKLFPAKKELFPLPEEVNAQ